MDREARDLIARINRVQRMTLRVLLAALVIGAVSVGLLVVTVVILGG